MEHHNEQPKTPRGRASRERIVSEAARLMDMRGVHATSLDDILDGAGASKSQLYHYFSNKDELVRAVVVHQTAHNLDAQKSLLDQLDSWEGIARWFDALVALQEQRACVGGCPIGSLASELADQDEPARLDLERGFHTWESYLVKGFQALRARGELRAQADPATLATATLASVEGGLLLTQTYKTTRPLRVALDAAFAYLRSFAPAGDPTTPADDPSR